jgi:hypothetical protein
VSLFQQRLRVRARSAERRGQKNVEPFANMRARFLGIKHYDFAMRVNGFHNCNLTLTMARFANGKSGHR